MHLRCFAILLVLSFSATAPAEDLRWRFEGWQGPAVPVRMFVPDEVTADTRVVIVLHGASRDARRYFRDWKAMGEQHNFIVVVPEFKKSKFRSSAEFNLGHVFPRGSTEQRPEPLWTFSAIEPLFDDVLARSGAAQKDYTIYGHSAGSQFVHRFLYYKPNARVNRYIAANAGWYTVPVNEFAYPYGLTESGLGDEDLARIFSRNLVILLGREDTNMNDDSLRKTPEAQRQGPHRLARGLTMYRVAKARAEELGLEFNWQLLVVPGADHVNAKMAPAAAAIVVQ